MPFGRRNTVSASPPAEQRRGERATTDIAATIRLPAGEPVDIVIEELSESGFRARVPFAVGVGMMVRVGLPNGRAPHARVARVDGDVVGCEFIAHLSPDDAKGLAD